MNTMLLLSYIVFFAFFLFILNKRKIFNLLVRKQPFNCTNCGQCCRLLVRLDEDDIEGIKKITNKDFVEKRDKKDYIKQVNGYCHFLKIENGKSECTIYEPRPKICRDFPCVKVNGIKSWDSRCPVFKLPKILRRL